MIRGCKRVRFENTLYRIIHKFVMKAQYFLWTKCYDNGNFLWYTFSTLSKEEYNLMENFPNHWRYYTRAGLICFLASLFWAKNNEMLDKQTASHQTCANPCSGCSDGLTSCNHNVLLGRLPLSHSATTGATGRQPRLCSAVSHPWGGLLRLTG